MSDRRTVINKMKEGKKQAKASVGSGDDNKKETSEREGYLV